MRYLDDGGWIEDDADNWVESDDEYSEPNDGIHGLNSTATIPTALGWSVFF